MLRFTHIAVLGALAAAFAVSGCGRKGALDPAPGSPAAAQPPPSSSRAVGLNPMSREASKPRSGGGFDEQGRPVGSQGVRKPLPIDWLID